MYVSILYINIISIHVSFLTEILIVNCIIEISREDGKRGTGDPP